MSKKFDPAWLLRLCSIPKIGSQRVRKLLAHFETPEAVINAAIQDLIRVAGIDRSLAELIRHGGDAAFAEEQLRSAQAIGAELISYWDDAYPALLKKISDPPSILFITGKAEVLHKQSVAIVGTRIPSTYGKLMTEKFSRDLVGNNLAIVSGLARGIDTVAHNSVVQMGGATIAVLGSGLDNIYPEENKPLAQKIMQEGAVISEFPMGSKPDAPHFPRRNRIISGLSLGTVVMEAGEKSGALITADCALEQNREVFALPGNANNPKCIGSNKLIQQGAKLVFRVDDILEELEGQLDMFRNASIRQKPNLTGMDEIIFNILSSSESKHIDKISAECQKPTSHVLSSLLSLELQGFVKQLVGKNFIKSY